VLPNRRSCSEAETRVVARTPVTSFARRRTKRECPRRTTNQEGKRPGTGRANDSRASQTVVMDKRIVAASPPPLASDNLPRVSHNNGKKQPTRGGERERRELRSLKCAVSGPLTCMVVPTDAGVRTVDATDYQFEPETKQQKPTEARTTIAKGCRGYRRDRQRGAQGIAARTYEISPHGRKRQASSIAKPPFSVFPLADLLLETVRVICPC